MNEQVVITSAAIYFEPKPGQPIPVRWFERARELFVEHSLSPILFTAGGGDFQLDDCHVLADRGGDLPIFGEVASACGAELLQALQSGEIGCLGLDSPQRGANDRENWRANVAVDPAGGECYVGVEERFAQDASALLRFAYGMASGIFPVRYGIVYKMPLSQRPEGYASGRRSMSFSDAREMTLRRRDWDARKKTRLELWGDELRGKRRHLTGLFRGAYPASVLSEAHVERAGLVSRGIGRLSPLDSSLWLWELSDSEVVVAEKVLEVEGVLVGEEKM